MASESRFKNWRIEAFNLELDYLELRFGFYPPIQSETELQKNSHEMSNEPCSGRAIFAGVNYLDFFKFRAFLKVTEIVISEIGGESSVKYRFNLDGDSYIEIVATALSEIVS